MFKQKKSKEMMVAMIAVMFAGTGMVIGAQNLQNIVSSPVTLKSTSCSANSFVNQGDFNTISCSSAAGGGTVSLSSTSCGANSFANQGQGTTISCSALPPASTISSTSCGLNSFVNQGQVTTLSCSGMPTISSTTCGANSYVNQVNYTKASCSAMPTISSTSCGANSFVNQATFTAVTCSAANFISTGATVSCSSQSYVTSIGTNTAVCNQPFIQVGPATTTQTVVGAAFTTINALQTSVAANTVYSVQAFIPYSCSAANTAAKFGVTAPTGTTLNLAFSQPIALGVALNYEQTATSISTNTSSTCPSTPGLGVFVNGYIQTSSTSGTFGFLFSVTTSFGVTMTIQNGAWMQLTNPSA